MSVPSEAGGLSSVGAGSKRPSMAAQSTQGSHMTFMNSVGSMRGGESDRGGGGSGGGEDILNPETSSLDEGLITEIAKIREFIRKENEARLGIKSAKSHRTATENGEEEDMNGDTVSNAETLLNKDRCRCFYLANYLDYMMAYFH